MWLQSWAPALPTAALCSCFPAGSVYVHMSLCSVAGRGPQLRAPGFWEMVMNITSPSLETQAALTGGFSAPRGPGPAMR